MGLVLFKPINKKVTCTLGVRQFIHSLQLPFIGIKKDFNANIDLMSY